MKKALLVLCLGYAVYRGYGYYQTQKQLGSRTKVEIHDDVTLGELKASLGPPDQSNDLSGGRWMFAWENGVQVLAQGSDDAQSPAQIIVGKDFKGEIRGLRIGQKCSTLNFPDADIRPHDAGMNHAALVAGDVEKRWAVMWTEDSEHKLNSMILAREVRYGYCPRGPLYKSVDF